MTTVVLTPSSTSPWTAPAGVTSVQVQCQGAGGTGANGATNSRAGGAGGGGEYAEQTITVTPGGNYSFTIGAGGSNTDTSFTGDTVTVTAHHGATATNTSNGAAGGTGSTNTIHHDGGGGGNGSVGTGNRGGGGGGGSAGASTGGGTGGNGTTIAGGSGGTAGTGSPAGAAGGSGSDPTSSNAQAGTAPGGGGGGGRSTSSVFSNGAAGAAGQITLTYTASTSHSGTADLSGSGTLTATGAFAGAAALSGSGTLTWSGSRIYKAVVLSGSGTLTGSRIGIIGASAALDGSGTLTAARAVTRPRAAALSGSGSLSIPGFTLGITLALTGTGTLAVIGTGGTVQASAGASSPYARPGASQVAVAPPGTPPSSAAWQYLGTLGLITSLTYSFTCPGGADKLTCTVMVPASYRTQLLNPGWQVRVTRGGHTVWTGRMDEPVPSASGWQVTAVGDGNRGQDFRAVYTSAWPAGEPDQAINNAISRGLPWVNPGVGSPSGIWLGQAQDSGSTTITDLLNLACTRGGLTWYVNSQPGGLTGSDLSIFPLPTAVNRLLVVTDPVARTLGGDINTVFIRYQITEATSDASGNSQEATYGTTSVQNAASVTAHGVTETYVDLSSAGVMSQAAAQAVGNKVLAIYRRASFAGPFTAAHGQLLNTGGAPIDPGTDQAGTVVRLILTDYGFGGEVTPGSPIAFITGAYSWDDFAQKATITPYQSLDESLSGLLSMETTVLTPITTQQ